MKSKLAVELFETLIDQISDAELNRMHAVIENYKQRSPFSYNALMKKPFSQNIIEMIEDNWAYRNTQLD